jgi:hypothetical protein
LLMGEYTDDLVNPFLHSEKISDYECNNAQASDLN